MLFRSPPRDENSLFDTFGQRLAEADVFAQARGIKLMIALDGLDKLTGRSDLAWLPSVLNSRARMLASSLEGPTRVAAEAKNWRRL